MYKYNYKRYIRYLVFEDITNTLKFLYFFSFSSTKDECATGNAVRLNHIFKLVVKKSDRSRNYDEVLPLLVKGYIMDDLSTTERGKIT